MYREISKCRISKSKNLIHILSLGEQSLSGVFPMSKTEEVSKGPLDLVWCPESNLLQLKQSYQPDEMYGDNYGYRSSLNISMVNHIQNKISYLERICQLSSGDLVIDVGSNDATLLKAYSNSNIIRVGVDPVGEKLKKYYTKGLEFIPDFFPTDILSKRFENKKATIITSLAMFYDLEDPRHFVDGIVKILDKKGVWHLEQSYMPSMLKMTAYDTICHEHLEYYSLGNIKSILNDCDLKILDVQINDINGGSLAVTACHKKSMFKNENKSVIDWVLLQEERMSLNTPAPFREFEKRVFEHRANLLDLIKSLNNDGAKIFGYGASTKGNVLLQFCGISEKELPYIAEVNQEKFGSFTPGTNIPIISEKEAHDMKPDYLFVLPWHFKNSILEREREFVSRGGKFIFPLPNIEIV